jgi:hypothetical protein
MNPASLDQSLVHIRPPAAAADLPAGRARLLTLIVALRFGAIGACSQGFE